MGQAVGCLGRYAGRDVPGMGGRCGGRAVRGQGGTRDRRAVRTRVARSLNFAFRAVRACVPPPWNNNKNNNNKEFVEIIGATHYYLGQHEQLRQAEQACTLWLRKQDLTDV